MAIGVKDVCAQIYADEKGTTLEKGKEWVQSIRAERFATDIFG